MRPGSIDEVIAAYNCAVSERQAIRDRIRGALEHVERLRASEAERTAIVRELRGEVRAFMDTQGTGEVAA